MPVYRPDILIVDDEMLVLMNYSDILEDAGFNVTTTSSLAQGCNMLLSRDFNLIICDHDLTDGKGSELLRKLADSGRSIPVIYLSAATASILEEVKKFQQVKLILSKPVDKEILVSSVKNFIKNLEFDNFPKLIGNEERNMLLDNL